MSLKTVHLTLIAIASLLSALVCAWAAAGGRDAASLTLAGASLGTTFLLGCYWLRVRRRLAQW